MLYQHVLFYCPVSRLTVHVPVVIAEFDITPSTDSNLRRKLGTVFENARNENGKREKTTNTHTTSLRDVLTTLEER